VLLPRFADGRGAEDTRFMDLYACVTLTRAVVGEKRVGRGWGRRHRSSKEEYAHSMYLCTLAIVSCGDRTDNASGHRPCTLRVRHLVN
jgi:hypothetical protein